MGSVTRYDVVVMGAGSGGIGAALAAARAGCSVLLVEKADQIGGTLVRGGVHVWEMGVGATGLPFDIYLRMKPVPLATGVYSIGRHFNWQDAWYWPNRLDKVNFPGGELLIDPKRQYIDSLQRHSAEGQVENEAFCRETWHGVVLEPQVYRSVVEQMLRETERCEIRSGCTFRSVDAVRGMIRSATLTDGSVVEAAAWVDATANVDLCVACGCPTMQGMESRDRFGEPDAPDQPLPIVNGVTLFYRITPTDVTRLEPLPAGVPETCWWAPNFPPMSCVQFPCRDRSCNMLPAMEGAEYLRLGEDAARVECERRARAHWRFVQVHFPEFQRFRIRELAPMMGVRETRRVVGEYVLTENDLVAGVRRQTHPDIVTLADHALDRHGQGGACPGLKSPYGVPYRCLIPKGFRNLLVACRGASFSSIAATSCRLTRTMMQLGQAAGTAAALARTLSVSLPEVPPEKLRQALRDQHAQIDWPMPEDLRKHLSTE